VTGSPARLVGAAAALIVGAIVLWQAGFIGGGDNASVAGVDLPPADTSVVTPAVDGFEVGLKAGDVAPDFELSSFDGQRIRLSDFRGRPVIVNFWATWCTPCREEMPAIEEAVRKNADANVAVLAVNRGERFSSAKDWVEKQGIVFTAFGYDPASAVFDQYHGTGMPTSFFVDAKGVITQVVAGPLRPSDLDSALQETIAGYGSGSN
jgi:cytochrome c biogenesis protein CcmG/thiol:disulfide interchange protein DsbE